MATATETRIDTTNKVLASFSNSRIERRDVGWYVVWPTRDGGEVCKRWVTRGQDFYPTWHHKWPGGGTASTALSQLIRWLRGQPVLPISTWRHWTSERIALLPTSAVDELIAGGYPEHAHCVLCGRQINGSMDWWSLNDVSGPCCGWTTGCRQRTTPQSAQREE